MKRLLFTLVTTLLLFSAFNQREIRIKLYDHINIPEFKMSGSYSIDTDGKYFYIKKSHRLLGDKYYCYDFFGSPSWYSLSISSPKKLVSKKHARYIYYHKVYKKSSSIMTQVN